MSMFLGSNFFEFDCLLLELNVVQYNLLGFFVDEVNLSFLFFGVLSFFYGVLEINSFLGGKVGFLMKEKFKWNGGWGLEDVWFSVESFLDELESFVFSFVFVIIVNQGEMSSLQCVIFI